MTGTLITAGRWLRRRAEDVAAALLALMFLAFIVQILARYVFNWPLGWTFEVSIVCWLWGVLWGAAFVVRERDEIRFDVIYGLTGPRLRRIFAVAAGLSLIALYGVSLPAVADYVGFMKVERSAYLKIPLNILFSVYVIFAVATLLRYLWLTVAALRGAAPDSILDPRRDRAP